MLASFCLTSALPVSLVSSCAQFCSVSKSNRGVGGPSANGTRFDDDEARLDPHLDAAVIDVARSLSSCSWLKISAVREAPRPFGSGGHEACIGPVLKHGLMSGVALSDLLRDNSVEAFGVLTSGAVLWPGLSEATLRLRGVGAVTTFAGVLGTYPDMLPAGEYGESGGFTLTEFGDSGVVSRTSILGVVSRPLQTGVASRTTRVPGASCTAARGEMGSRTKRDTGVVSRTTLDIGVVSRTTRGKTGAPRGHGENTLEGKLVRACTCGETGVPRGQDENTLDGKVPLDCEDAEDVRTTEPCVVGVRSRICELETAPCSAWEGCMCRG
jgi:hypothetical protein